MLASKVIAASARTEAMSLDAINLDSVEELYAFVENAVPKTGLIIAFDAAFRPWVRTLSADCQNIRWFYPERPLSSELLRHISNMAHTPMPEKGFILLKNGRIIKVIDLDAVDGASRPDRLGTIARNAFSAKTQAQENSVYRGNKTADPYQVLEASESDSEQEIKRKYKQMISQYHPDRVAHLGSELRDLAATKTTEINTAFSKIRKARGF